MSYLISGRRKAIQLLNVCFTLKKMGHLGCHMCTILLRQCRSQIQQWRWLSVLPAATKGPLNFINGARVHPMNVENSIPVIEPATGQVITKLPLSQLQDVQRGVSNSLSVWKSWACSSPTERGDILCRTAEIIKVSIGMF